MFLFGFRVCSMGMLQLVVLLGYCGAVSAGNPKKDVLAHLACPVCEQMVVEAETYAKTNKLASEEDLSDLMEHLCTVKKKEGRWVTSLDISQAEDSLLKVERRTETGECHRECHLIQLACVKALANKEADLADMLRAADTVASIQKSICKKSCKNKALPKLPAWEDEEFKARDAAMLAQEDLLPPGMQAYNAQDILGMSKSDQLSWFADQEHKKRQRESRAANEL